MINYGFEITVDLTVCDAENKITAEMKKEGFGLVSRINMKEKFKEKLGIDYRKYLILGFCNPRAAYEAVEVEDNIGLLLPCNITVYEKGGETVISAIRPTVAMSVVDNPELKPAALNIEEKLKAAIERIISLPHGLDDLRSYH